MAEERIFASFAEKRRYEYLKAEKAKKNAPKVRINVDEVARIMARLGEINRTPFVNIEWVNDKGETVPYDVEAAEAFHFTGLANKDFVDFEISDPDGQNMKKGPQSTK